MNMNSKQISIFYILLFSLCISVFPISIYSQTQQERFETACKARKEAYRLKLPDINEINSYLDNGDFIAVETIFTKINQKYQEDCIYEQVFQRGFELFEPKNNISEDNLDTWVKSTNSAIAYTARGIYYTQKGFDARGNKFISETSESQLELMSKYMSQAAADLIEAVSKDSSIMPAYCWLIIIAKQSGDIPSSEMVLRRALQIDQKTYYVRAAFMSALYPRWGGSRIAMNQFAQECIEFSALNPLIWTLQGEVDFDIGRTYWDNQNYEKAIIHLTASMSYGEYPMGLRMRGGCYYSLGEYQKAVDDLQKALSYDRNDEIARKWLTINQLQLVKLDIENNN